MTEASLKPGWTKVKFGDVVRQVKDKVDPETSGLERYIAGEHMDTDDLRIRRWGEIGDDYLGPAFHMRFKPGHVLYGSRRTYLRKVAFPHFEGICANTTFVLEPIDSTVLLPELIPFIMQTESFHDHSIKQSKGSVNPYVNFSDLAWWTLEIPPLSEQENIIKPLVSIEENIDFLYEAEMSVKQLWRALSNQEFSPDKCSQDSPLKNHYSIVGGQVDPKQEEFAKLPLIAPNHIESETGELLGLETAAEQNAISGKYLYESGAVLYSKIRPNLVKATIAPYKGLCSADMYALTPKRSLKKEYLLELILSDVFTQFSVSGSMRTGMPKLNRKQLELFKFKVPTIEDQENYLQKTLAVKTAWKEVSARKKKLVSLKKRILKEIWSESV